ncbi:MAG: CBS domain-containing protein [Sphingobacterium composti]
MQLRQDFIEIVKEIKANPQKEFSITTREFLAYFNYEKRTKGNNARITDFLEKNDLETDPPYINSWIDKEITLKHKTKARSKREKDPILRISILPSANKPPITINRDAKISDAITLMMMHNFSQLPVMSNPRSVAGFITWETIGIGITNGNTSSEVKDFLKMNITILNLDTPFTRRNKNSN